MTRFTSVSENGPVVAPGAILTRAVQYVREDHTWPEVTRSMVVRYLDALRIVITFESWVH